MDDLKAELIALDVHSDMVSSVIIQDNKVMSGSGDKTIRLWDLKNPKSEPIVLDDDYSAVVSSVAIQNNKVVLGSWDRFVRVWNLEDLNMENQLCWKVILWWSIVLQFKGRK